MKNLISKCAVTILLMYNIGYSQTVRKTEVLKAVTKDVTYDNLASTIEFELSISTD